MCNASHSFADVMLIKYNSIWLIDQLIFSNKICTFKMDIAMSDGNTAVLCHCGIISVVILSFEVALVSSPNIITVTKK